MFNRSFLRLAVLVAALFVWLLPGSSIAAACIGGFLLWRSRQRRNAERARWQALSREQQLDETLPADWRSRTRENTFPDRLM